MNTTARLTTIALSSAALLASSAGIAEAKGFDLWTSTAATKGRAHGYGSLTFPNAKTVKVNGKINDICPADGFGAYIEFKVNFSGGGYGVKRYADRQTCKKGAVPFAFTQAFTKKVKSVGVTVIELDDKGGTMRVGDAKRTLIVR